MVLCPWLGWLDVVDPILVLGPGSGVTGAGQIVVGFAVEVETSPISLLQPSPLHTHTSISDPL